MTFFCTFVPDAAFKSSWRDEYLKWICAFANTNGGRLLIGVDDNGNPVGVKDSKTAFLELSELTGKGLLEIHGSGRGVLYTFGCPKARATAPQPKKSLHFAMELTEYQPQKA